MKFCFFDFNVNFGGAPRGSISLCARLRQGGADVIVYDAYGANQKYVEFARSHDVPVRVLFPRDSGRVIGGKNVIQRTLSALLQVPEFIGMAITMRRMIKADKVSVLWVNNKKSLFMAVLACSGMKVNKVLYHRGWAEDRDIDGFYRWIVKAFCVALIGHSRATVDNLSRIFPRKQVVYVPNAVDIPCELIMRERSYVKKTGGEFSVLLPAARPVREKGHDVAVQALHILIERGLTDIRLIFPGASPMGDSGIFLQQLLLEIAMLGLDGRVDFIGWVDDMERLISECDLVILPSHTEGFPRVIIEAMLLGTPVIATPVGGIPEAILHEQTGILVPLGDVVALADSIERLYKDRDLSRKLASAARKFAMLDFSGEKQARVVLEIFSSLSREGA